MPVDARGLTVTAASDAAAQALDDVVAAYCGLRRDAGDCMKRALASDPRMVLAHVVRGYFMLLFATHAAVGRAGAAARAAAAAIAAAGATPREHRHLAALETWARGDLEGAVAAWRGLLEAYPRDILALKLAQYGGFYLGDAAGMRTAIGGALPAWEEGTPGRGFVLGCHAFALEECGAYDAAERAGREAVSLEPGDIWAAHAVAHCCEMQDRAEDGLAWIAAQEGNWGAVNNFIFHVRWHRCLFLLALDRREEVLALYDREVRAESTDEYLDITNAVSLLWRLEQDGIAVGGRWQELAERAAAHLDDHALVFADVHYLMALAAVGDDAGCARWRDLARAHATGDDTAARVLTAVGLALGEAALAHRSGDWPRVVAALAPVRHEIHRIGGSHAQRDLFAAMLIDAALEAGADIAPTLLRERLAARPRNAWGRRRVAKS